MEIKITNVNFVANYFQIAHYLRKHIYTVHESHKDHKCESCFKSYTTAQNLRKHIHTVHEDHK